MEETFRRRPVSTIMRTHVVTVGPEETMLEAARIMQLARIRHLPVVESGLLVGMLSDRDVLGASPASLESADESVRANHLRSVEVRKVMSPEPEAVPPGCPLGEAAVRMLRLKISCLPIVEAGTRGPRLLGLLTQSDLVQAAYAPEFSGASD
jgi:CBS domain-containing protein